MPWPETTAEQFCAIWEEEKGAVVRIALRLGVPERSVYARRARLTRAGYVFPANLDCHNPGGGITPWAYPRQIDATVSDGLVVAFGDLHSTPLDRRAGDTPAMRLLLAWLDEHGAHVQLLLCMGDVLDASTIGRHPPLGWKDQPSIADEIGAAVHDLDRIAALAPHAERLFTVGNHDERFDRVLAQQAKEFRQVTGMRLQDHFERWRMAWSVRINGDIVATHKRHGGVHAAHNNTMKSFGAHVITGDTHRLTSLVQTGLLGPIYGVESGTLADPFSSQFEYTRGLDPNWQPGFAVLPIANAELHRPFTVSVLDAPKRRVRVKAGSP